MLGRFLPRQENFFIFFDVMAAELLKTAQAFYAMVNDLENAQRYAEIIASHEKKADEIILRTLEALHKTFITPFDRHDIHQLIQQMEDVVDYIYRAAQRLFLHQLKEIPAELSELAKAIVHLAELIERSVKLLPNLKNGTEILKLCREIYDVEDAADQTLLKGVVQLLKNDGDVRAVLKNKDVFDYMKGILSHSESVGAVVHQIVLEYS